MVAGWGAAPAMVVLLNDGGGGGGGGVGEAGDAGGVDDAGDAGVDGAASDINAGDVSAVCDGGDVGDFSDVSGSSVAGAENEVSEAEWWRVAEMNTGVRGVVRKEEIEEVRIMLEKERIDIWGVAEHWRGDDKRMRALK